MGSGSKRSDGLLRDQSIKFSMLVGRVLEAAYAARNAGEPSASASPTTPVLNNVFCIDGGRGCGKTHVLRMLHELLCDVAAGRHDQEIWAEYLEGHVGRLRGSPQDRPVLIVPLKIVFPDDLEAEESVLEAVFAAIRSDIEGLTKANSAAADEGKELLELLIQKVSMPWNFARRLGAEAIVRNSIDYKDLVRRHSDLNQLAANRRILWQSFIERYLKWRGADCLAILVDDADVRPVRTSDVIQAALTALNLPRLVTVMAGNVESMRRSMVLLAMRDLAPAIPPLNLQRQPTADEWRRAERIEVEQILAKVLPESHRFYLNKPDHSEDFRLLSRSGTLRELSEKALERRRPEFVRIKMLRSVAFDVTKSDRPSERQAAALQDYLAWWVFRTKYTSMLAPTTPRQMKVFLEYFESSDAGEEQPSPAAVGPSEKRLPVALFYNPANYALIQHFSDEDTNVIEWLMRQPLDSTWIKQRSFTINGREVRQGTYSYNYLRFRLDVGLSQPLRRNSEALVPEGLLPWVRGRQRMRPFFLPRFMPKTVRKLGVAHWLDHAAIPGNCIYFHDLSALPDNYFVERHNEAGENQAGRWEASLWGRWPALLDPGRDETLQRYITDVVYRRLRPTASVRSTTIIDQLEPPDHADGKLPYQEFVRFELATLTTDKDQLLFEAARAIGEKRSSGAPPRPPPELVDPARLLARYSAMATDVRRAWAAVRIYHNAVDSAEEMDGLDRQGPAPQAMFDQIRNADRMRLYTIAEFRDALNRDNWVTRMTSCFSRERLVNLVDLAKGAPAVPGPVSSDLWDQIRARLPGVSEEAFRSVVERLEEHAAAGSPAPGALSNATTLLASLGSLGDADAAPVEMESNSTEWVAGWRQIGRLMCNGWYLERDHEDDIVRKDDPGKLDIFATTGKELNDWRSARAFTWFLYGVAPSMAAVIHADLMSRVHRLVQLEAEIARDQKRNPDSISETRLREINTIRSDMLAAIQHWESTIIELTGTIRYIKMKCLQLYTILICERIIQRGSNSDVRVEKLLQRDLDRADIKALNERLKVAADKFPQAGEQAGGPGLKAAQVRKHIGDDTFWTVLRQALGDEADGRRHAGRLEGNTNMMPDASPSTLFGDGWLEDVLLRLAGCEGENRNVGVSYGGVFGETERWLWAAHFMLRTLTGNLSQATNRFTSNLDLSVFEEEGATAGGAGSG